MCRIINTRKTSSTVFMEIDDGEYWGVKKIPVEKFDYAKGFRNNDFLGEVGTWTTDRDFNEVISAVPFTDPMINYATV